jgi:hypothetical protein
VRRTYLLFVPLVWLAEEAAKQRFELEEVDFYFSKPA